jgi:hypothetical protein
MDSSRITRRRWIAGTGSALASSTLRRTRNLFRRERPGTGISQDATCWPPLGIRSGPGQQKLGLTRVHGG